MGALALLILGLGSLLGTIIGMAGGPLAAVGLFLQLVILGLFGFF